MAITTTNPTSQGLIRRLRASRMAMTIGILCALCLTFVPQCARAQTLSVPGGQPAAMAPDPISSPTLLAQNPIQAGSLLIGSGDLIEVQVFSTPELSGRIRVDQDGTIRLPIGFTVTAAGLTPAQVGNLLETQLKDKQIMLDPHVNAFVIEYATQGITILGEVRTPGTYNLLGPHSLYDALSAAGGVNATQGSTITITHKEDPDHLVIVPIISPNYSSLEQATGVRPGDVIVVSKASTITVVGDVVHSGAYYLQNGEPLSVLNAVALAAGLNRTANASKASIIRPTTTGAETIPIDLYKIMKNQAPNTILHAADILVVPSSGLKIFLDTAIPSFTSAVTGSVATALVIR